MGFSCVGDSRGFVPRCFYGVVSYFVFVYGFVYVCFKFGIKFCPFYFFYWASGEVVLFAGTVGE